jgi:hypothetical protein
VVTRGWLMVLPRTRWSIRERCPLLVPLLACLGIQGLLSVVLLALAMLTDPTRARPAPAEAIVRVPRIADRQAYVAGRETPARQPA